jgi:GT2 family glycosyltransferase
MRLSIVIVSWNVAPLLEACLRSIAHTASDLAPEIIVVDNASRDGSAQMVAEKFPEVKLIANTRNLGFPAANNQGILVATGNYVLLLNPDTKVLENTLATCVEFMEQHPDCGVLGCKHLNPDETWQSSVRRLPRLRDQLLIFTKLAKLAPRLPTLNSYYCRDLDLTRDAQVDQVAGSFFLIRRELLDEIGLLDDEFFIWFEEVDYCKRAKQAGWEVWYTPRANIVHYGGQSFAQRLTLTKQKLFFKSAWRYFSKHGFTW